jgi:hypothetical protein
MVVVSPRLRTDAPAVYGRPRTAVRHARPWRHGRPGRPATDAPPSDWRQAGCFRLSSRLRDPLHSLRDPMLLCMTFITDVVWSNASNQADGVFPPPDRRQTRAGRLHAPLLDLNRFNHGWVTLIMGGSL